MSIRMTKYELNKQRETLDGFLTMWYNENLTLTFKLERYQMRQN